MQEHVSHGTAYCMYVLYGRGGIYFILFQIPSIIQYIDIATCCDSKHHDKTNLVFKETVAGDADHFFLIRTHLGRLHPNIHILPCRYYFAEILANKTV